MSRSIDRVARELLDLKRQVRHISTQPQLAYSSVEGGYVLWNDNEGNPALVVGAQFDGTNAASVLTGPPPPTPTTPVAVEAHLNSGKVNWDGLFAEGALVPMDFSRVEIHAVDAADDEPDTAATLVGTYETPRGGDTMVPLSGPKYIRFVARSLSGARSDASPASELITPVTSDDITAEVATIANDAHDIATAAQATADGLASDVAGAASDAATALAAASAAQTAADAAAAVHYATTDPTGTPGDGDLWNKEDGSDVIIAQWVGVGGSWVPTTIADAVIANLSAAKISTGTLAAARIGANSIDTSKLTISNLSNLIEDPGFEAGGKNLGGSFTVATIGDPANGGTKAIQVASVTGNTPGVEYAPNTNGIPVVPGEVYYFSFRLRKTTAGTTGAIRSLGVFNLDGGSVQNVTLADTNLSSLTTNTWTTVSGMLTVPSGANRIKPRVQFQAVATGDTLQTDDWTFRKATDGTLIVDGAVTATKLAAGAVTAGKLLITPGGGNMLSNSNFADTTAFPAGFGFATRSSETGTTFAQSGKALRLTNAGNSTFGVGCWLVNGGTVGDNGFLKPNTTYTISAWVYIPTSSTNIVGVKISADNAASATIPVMTTKGSWQRVVTTFTTGASGTAINSILVTQGALTAVQTDYYIVGAVQLELGDIPSAYAPKVDEILPGTISTPMLQAGSVTTTVLAANAATIDKLAIGSFDNVLNDPTFSQPIGTSWQNTASIQGSAGHGVLSNALRITNAASNQICYNLPLNQIRVDGQQQDVNGVVTRQGDSYLLTVWVNSSVLAAQGTILLGATFIDYLGTQTTYTVDAGADIAATTWTKFSGQVTAPPNAQAVSFFVETTAALSTGTVDFWQPTMTRAMVGELIVDGEIKGQHIAAQSITTSHLVADFFEAGFVYTGNLQVGQITLDDVNGLQIPGPDGTTVFPIDGTATQIVGTVVTSSIRIKDDLTISGISQLAGEMDLTAGIVAPTAKPVVSSYYPSVISTLGNGSDDNHIFFAGLDDYHGDTANFVTASIFFGTKIRKINKATGAWGLDLPAASWNSQFYSWGGIAYDGAHYYLLGSDNDRNSDTYLYSINTDGTKNTELRIGNSSAFNGQTPRLISDKVNNRVGMIWIPLSGNLMLRWYNSSLVKVGSDITLKTGVGQQDLGDAYYGDAGSGLGANTLWVTVAAGSALPDVMCWSSVTTSAATRSSSYDFKRANGNKCNAMTYDTIAGRMQTIDYAGTMRWYSKLGAGNTTLSFQACYTWYDGDNSVYPAGTWGDARDGTASGTHETQGSPTQNIAVPKRSWPTVTWYPPPDDKVTDSTRVDKANRVGLYLAAGGTLFRVGYQPAPSGTPLVGTYTWSATPTNNGDVLPTSGTVPVSNGFSTAYVTPGRIQSATLNADGKPKLMLDGTQAEARIDGLIPPGTVVMWAGATAPAGWLLCDGASQLRTSYAALFATIGTAYGSVDGTHFNVPDMRSRFPAGVGAFAVRGQTEGGLVGPGTDDSGRTNRMSHSHDHGAGTMSTSSKSLSQQTNTTTGGGANRLTSPDSHNHDVTGRTSTDSGIAAGTVHAYTALNFIIKT